MRKLELDKKDVEIKNTTVSTKLNMTQLKLFKLKAQEKNYSTSELLREIIIKYLDEDVSHENLLQTSMLKVMEKVDDVSEKQEFFQQLFYCWLSQWFLTHPKLENKKDNDIVYKNSISRRNDFVNKFISSIYNENEELYEFLFANKVENETEE